MVCCFLTGVGAAAHLWVLSVPNTCLGYGSTVESFVYFFFLNLSDTEIYSFYMLNYFKCGEVKKGAKGIVLQSSLLYECILAFFMLFLF